MAKLFIGTLAAFLLNAPGGDSQNKHRPATDHSITLSFKSLDLDGDGKVTREEFMDAFAKLDHNHDGAITPDELPTRDAHGDQGKHPKQKPGNQKRKR